MPGTGTSLIRSPPCGASRHQLGKLSDNVARFSEPNASASQAPGRSKACSSSRGAALCSRRWPLPSLSRLSPSFCNTTPPLKKPAPRRACRRQARRGATNAEMPNTPLCRGVLHLTSRETGPVPVMSLSLSPFVLLKLRTFGNPTRKRGKTRDNSVSTQSLANASGYDLPGKSMLAQLQNARVRIRFP